MSTRQVVLDGGSPWGFRIHGGKDVGSPLKISRVNPGSKAALKGIREGDVISSINGTSTKNIDNRAAHSLLRNAGQHLSLSLNENGSPSPRRSKQTSIVCVFTDRNTVSEDSPGDKIESQVTEEKIKAQIHAEDTNERTKENGEL